MTLLHDGGANDEAATALVRSEDHAYTCALQQAALPRDRRFNALDVDDLADHPGLKSALDQALERAYRYARSAGLSETHVAERGLPEVDPYGWTKTMERDIAWREE